MGQWKNYGVDNATMEELWVHQLSSHYHVVDEKEDELFWLFDILNLWRKNFTSSGASLIRSLSSSSTCHCLIIIDAIAKHAATRLRESWTLPRRFPRFLAAWISCCCWKRILCKRKWQKVQKSKRREMLIGREAPMWETLWMRMERCRPMLLTWGEDPSVTKETKNASLFRKSRARPFDRRGFLSELTLLDVQATDDYEALWLFMI